MGGCRSAGGGTNHICIAMASRRHPDRRQQPVHARKAPNHERAGAQDRELFRLSELCAPQRIRTARSTMASWAVPPARDESSSSAHKLMAAVLIRLVVR